MTSESFYSHVYSSWDFQEESDKAAFMEFLFDLYQPEDHTYTGLWERFSRDVSEMYRERFCDRLRDSGHDPLTILLS